MKAIVEIPLVELGKTPASQSQDSLVDYPCTWTTTKACDLDQYGRPFTAPTHQERHANDNLPEFTFVNVGYAQKLERAYDANFQHGDKEHWTSSPSKHMHISEPGDNQLSPLFNLQEEDFIMERKSNKRSDKHNHEDDEEEPLWKTILTLLWGEKFTIFCVTVSIILMLILQYRTTWKDLNDDAWFTMWVLWATMVALVRGITDPDIALFGGCTMLLFEGIIKPTDAFSGLGNDSVIVNGLMLVVAKGMEETGAIEYISKYCMGRPWNLYTSQFRFMITNGFISAWTNNIPQVAVFIPVVEAWCQRYGLPPSKYMIPLSYATILGGLITIIGTSANLVVKGLAQDVYPNMTMPFFEIGAMGAPLTIAGIIYVSLASPFLLPNRQGAKKAMQQARREYTVRVAMRPTSPLIGYNVEQNNLRHLPGLFLVDIERKTGEVIPAPSGEVLIESGDRLTFTGVVSGARYLWKSTDFVPTFDGTSAISGQRCLVEAVINKRSPLIGHTVRNSRFRSEYNAAILSIHRGGKAVSTAIGDCILQSGDTLLLEASPGFVEEHRHNPAFALVSSVEHSLTVSGSNWKMRAAFTLMIALVTINAQDGVEVELSNTALACVFAYFALGIVSPTEAKKSTPSCTLLTIAGGFGFAKALTYTGIAKQMAHDLVGSVGALGEMGSLYGIYVSTVILTALLSNGASATLMFSIAVETAKATGLHAKSFMYILALAASADFSTPIGYQTNLMVAGPGGYKFVDYVKIGLPLQFVCGLVSVPLAFHLFAK
eukprot:TRINITY_DN2463_c0_g1_i1.p1 TRINITY_DN2463_c0_g1~~TRINITY_DN2463_c0_g1_i1.p1  ORF type:complete len:772 (+),score=171.56 TRINITY_DN2463_c0_g1_i1:71-2386(+)